MNVLDYLRKFDGYPKTLEEFRVRTAAGALITVISSIIIVVLIVSEFTAYWSIHISEELFVDTTRSHKLKINLDIYVPSISCDYLSLDAMDSSGDQHLHIEHNVFKRRIDLMGNPITDPIKEEMVIPTTKKVVNVTTEVQEVKCGSCYGAESNTTHCCTTCQDVIDAYREKRWHPKTEEFIQCKDEKFKDKDKEKLALNEGCQVYGYMEVNRMSGSFHVAPGQSFSINHIHVHDVQPFSSTSFNTSHKINHLSFGDRIRAGTANTHPIDGMDVTASEGATMFQYYIKIVPTMYVQRNGEVINTNQFSVTRHSKSVSVVSGESGMPGIFFSYELSPLMHKYTEKDGSLGHFFVNVCGIFGGIYVMAFILDSFLHNHVISQKIELGKIS